VARLDHHRKGERKGRVEEGSGYEGREEEIRSHVARTYAGGREAKKKGGKKNAT
jgi:hypothetical protein